MAKQKISGYYTRTTHEDGKLIDRDYAQDHHGLWYTRTPKSTVSKAWRELTGEYPRREDNGDVFIYVDGKGDVKLTYVDKNIELPEMRLPVLHDDLEFDADVDFSIPAPPATALQHIGFNYGVMPMNDAMDLKASAERIKVRLKRTNEEIIEIGKELMTAKGKCGFGHWEMWLSAEFDMTDRTAQNIMNVAKTFGGKSEIISVLNATALYALSAPSTSEAVRTEVLQRVENGESINAAEINRLKKEKADINALLTKEKVAKSNAENLLHNAKIELSNKEKEAQRLLEDLTSTQSSLNLAINNIDEEVKQGIKERLPEITEQAEAKAKAKLEIDYQDEIAIKQESIDSLKAQIDNDAMTIEELAKKKAELRVAEQSLADYSRQLEALSQQIADRQKTLQTDQQINEGFCHVIDSLIGGIAAALSQLDIDVDNGTVTAPCPLTETTKQKIDKAIAKLDDTMQLFTLLLRTK